MPIYEATREIEIAAQPAEVFAVLTDYERMPEWQSRMAECNVLSRDDEGRACEVEYVIDVKLRSVRYRVRHLYDEPGWIGSEYLGGDFRCFEGEYTLTDQRGDTNVEFRLRIDPGLRVPGRIAKMLNDAVMGRALEDLQKRVEAVASGA
jgi:ribosome-associated toxin RatA of RatAB toxin-antitoxin module